MNKRLRLVYCGRNANVPVGMLNVVASPTPAWQMSGGEVQPVRLPWYPPPRRCYADVEMLGRACRVGAELAGVARKRFSQYFVN